jgi:hypothetical protein
MPTSRIKMTDRKNLFSLAPIGGEGWGEGAGFASQINSTVLFSIISIMQLNAHAQTY